MDIVAIDNPEVADNFDVADNSEVADNSWAFVCYTMTEYIHSDTPAVGSIQHRLLRPTELLAKCSFLFVL